MTTYRLHAFDPYQAVSLADRAYRIIAERDAKDWESLFDSLAAVHCTPNLSDGRVWSSAVPLTQCSYYASVPDLKKDELPDKRSLEWAMRRLIEMDSPDRCLGGWSKFGGDFTIHIQEEVLPVHPHLAGPQAQFMETVLAPPAAEIPQLQFMKGPDSYAAVLKPETLATLIAVQDSTNHLATCAQVFMSKEESLWQSFGEDIKRMELFLRAAALRSGGDRAVWFTCAAT